MLAGGAARNRRKIAAVADVAAANLAAPSRGSGAPGAGARQSHARGVSTSLAIRLRGEHAL